MCTLTLCWQLVYYVSVYCCQSHRRSVGIKFEPIWNSVLLPFWKSIQSSGLDHPQIFSWCKKFLCIVFWLTSVKPSYSKSLSICIDFCLLQLHQLHDLMYDKSTDIKCFHFLQHPAMYACAKFVTSPAVVSKLTANSGTRLSHFGEVSTIWRESKSQWRFGIPTLTAKLKGFLASSSSRTQLRLTATLEPCSCRGLYIGICVSWPCTSQASRSWSGSTFVSAKARPIHLSFKVFLKHFYMNYF